MSSNRQNLGWHGTVGEILPNSLLTIGTSVEVDLHKKADVRPDKTRNECRLRRLAWTFSAFDHGQDRCCLDSAVAINAHFSLPKEFRPNHPVSQFKPIT